MVLELSLGSQVSSRQGRTMKFVQQLQRVISSKFLEYMIFLAHLEYCKISFSKEQLGGFDTTAS